MKRLSIRDKDFFSQLTSLLSREEEQKTELSHRVASIIARVRKEGDSALIAYCKEFDNITLSASALKINQEEIARAKSQVSFERIKALQLAFERIEHFHKKQLQQSWQYQEADGSVYGQKITPLNRVGVYVPGGKASYPSSVLMNAIPAKVAGVAEVIMVTPTPNGEISPMVLAAADIAGVDAIYRIGGAQAIAALAYGTETIAAVDKITGPGNVFVAEAKKHVFGKVGIDMIAGPSEVLIIADESAKAEWVAMDLFAQAEHDEMAQSILLTQSENFAHQVERAMKAVLPTMQRKDIIHRSLEKNGAIIVVESLDELIEVANIIAAEHLEIAHIEADALAQAIQHAGAIFIGNYSAESFGDYCAGPNHVLPTSGTARFSSPLGVYDFQKKTSIVKISEQGARALANTVDVLAQGESMDAHAQAATLRIADK